MKNKTRKFSMLICMLFIFTNFGNVAFSAPTNELKVHYINVGQADSILIQQNNQSMLIDAGNNPDGALVVNYLKNQGIKKLDYLIGTHPHEDHIGGLDTVIKSFNIGKIYMPKATSTTNTFRDVVNAIKAKNMKISVPKVGETFKIGNAQCTILAPNNAKYDDLNNYSIVTKLRFGNTSFLFMGDAESLSEGEILQKQLDVKADVIKIGHHGSHSSTSSQFLSKVKPKYAVVSCEKSNDYGHPHKETMSLLKAKHIPLFRTDEVGTIVATSNGKVISFNKKAGTYNAGSKSIKKTTKLKPVAPVKKSAVKKVIKPATNISTTVYITNTGEKYHLGSCSSLKKSKISISLKDAKAQGYTACKKCHPPQ